MPPLRTLLVKEALWDTILPAWGFFKSGQTIHALPPPKKKQKKMGNAQIDGAFFINVLILWHLGYVVCPIFSSKLPLFTTIFFLCSEPTQCIVSMLYRDKFSLPVGQKKSLPTGQDTLSQCNMLTINCMGSGHKKLFSFTVLLQWWFKRIVLCLDIYDNFGLMQFNETKASK